MVEQPPLEPGRVGQVEPVDRLPGLDQPQQPKAAIKQADIAVGSDHGRRMIADADAADQIALRAETLERQVQPGDQPRRARRSDQDGAVPRDAFGGRKFLAEQAGKAAAKLGPGRLPRRRSARPDELGRGRRILALPCRLDRPVAQPEVVAVLRARLARRDQGNEQQQDDQGQAMHYLLFLSTVGACLGMAKPWLSW